MKIKIFILSIIISSSYLIIIGGGWIRGTFAEDSAYLDSASSTAIEEIKSTYSLNEDDCLVYPLEVYSQVVNGINYKLLYAFYNTTSKEVDFYNATVYVGPAGEMKCSVLSTNQIKMTSNYGKYPKKTPLIIKAIKDYEGLDENDGIKIYIKSAGNNALVSGSKVYVAYNVENFNIYCIYEDQSGNMYVDAIIYP